MTMRMVARRLTALARLVLIGFVVAYALFPLYWALVSSLKTGTELFDVTLLPLHPSLDNYSAVFREQPFVRNILNSFLVALSTVAIALTLSLTAAYALGRVAFRGRSVLLVVVLGVSMFPQIAVLSGLFELIRALGLYNNPVSLTLAYLIFTLPFTTWVLTTFMRQCHAISRRRQSSMVRRHGSRSRAYSCRSWGRRWRRRDCSPLSWHGTSFLFALTFTLTNEMRTVPVAIALITGASQYELPWGKITAASVIVTAPLVILVLIFQRQHRVGANGGRRQGISHG